MPARFQKGQVDHMLFLKRLGSQTTILIFYVDDTILMGDKKKKLERLNARAIKVFLRDGGG